MAFPDGWERKVELVIQASQVSANLTNFPVLLTEDTLPTEMLDSGDSNHALNGGGDIRFSSDSDGTTQLACEVISFVLDGAAEIWVKVPSVSSSTNTSFWCWYKKSGESQPARDSTYGLENVWDSNFKCVHHNDQDPSSGNQIDSTANTQDGYHLGSMDSNDLVSAKIGNGLDLDGVNDRFRITEPESPPKPLEVTTDYTLSLWLKRDNTSRIEVPIMYDTGYASNSAAYMIRIEADDTIGLWHQNGSNSATIYSSGTIGSGSFAFFVATHTGGESEIFIGGASSGGAQTHRDPVYAGNVGRGLSVGIFDDGSYVGAAFDGIIDEVRISDTNRADEWISAEYNNQNSPSTFVIEGTPEGTLDETAPTITAHSPAKFATDVSLGTSLYFELDDDNSGVDSSTINVTINGTAAITAGAFQTGYSGTITADGLGYNVTIVPDSAFGENILITVLTTGVKDIALNEMSTDTWTFTTGTEMPTIYWRNRLRAVA